MEDPAQGARLRTVCRCQWEMCSECLEIWMSDKPRCVICAAPVYASYLETLWIKIETLRVRAGIAVLLFLACLLQGLFWILAYVIVAAILGTRWLVNILSTSPDSTLLIYSLLCILLEK